MGKCCLHASPFIFDWIIIKVAGNQDKHKTWMSLIFGPDQTTHFGVTCLWMTKILHFRTWISLRPVGQSWSNFMYSIAGVGKGCIMFWGRLDQNSGVHGNRKPPLTYNGENGVSTFSWLPNFGPNQITHFGVTCPWVTKISHIWTWISLKPVGQSWSNFMCSIIWGWGKAA